MAVRPAALLMKEIALTDLSERDKVHEDARDESQGPASDSKQGPAIVRIRHTRGVAWGIGLVVVLSAATAVSYVLLRGPEVCDDLLTDAERIGRRLQGGREIFVQPIVITDVIPSDINRVIDGDTICVTHPAWESVPESLRLVCIDAPERREAYFEQATNALAAWLRRGDNLTISQVGVDGTTRGRPLTHLSFADGSDKANLWLVEQGLATFNCFGNCSRECDVAAFSQAEAAARDARRGIWGAAAGAEGFLTTTVFHGLSARA